LVSGRADPAVRIWPEDVAGMRTAPPRTGTGEQRLVVRGHAAPVGSRSDRPTVRGRCRQGQTRTAPREPVDNRL